MLSSVLPMATKAWQRKHGGVSPLHVLSNNTLASHIWCEHYTAAESVLCKT